ncbi:helix-turn-helix domain-containing protein [Pikeienuella piscinae]|nr:helix-turn-helix transcriptional regulator [Pikeienuella piscinae]
MADDIDWPIVAERLRKALSHRRMPVQQLADQSAVHRKTVDRLLQGERIAPDSLLKIERALGERLDESGAPPAAAAPGVAAPAANEGLNPHIPESYVGAYLIFRRSFDHADRIICSALEITRDPVSGHGRFHERLRTVAPDGRKHFNDFKGDVNHAVAVGALQLVAIDDGYLRTVNLGRLRREVMEDGETREVMRGVLQTMNEVLDIGYYPVASPVHVMRTDLSATEAEKAGKTGSFGREGFWEPRIAADLDEVMTKFFPPKA